MWYEAISSQWMIAVNENGWTINKIGLIWLKTVFNEHTKMCTVEQYWLLILNSHESHMISEFDWFCLNNAIITLCMPLHLLHLLQSLNVSCFSLLKHTYEHQVKICMQLKHNHIDKLDFLKAFKPACTAALSSSNIHSRFAAAELVSYDSEWVLSHLQLKLWMLTSSALKMVIAVCQTSKTLYTVAQLAQEYVMIKELLKQHLKSPSSSTNQALKQMVKGYQMTMHNTALMTSEIKDLWVMSTHQKCKQEAPHSYIASEGVLTVKEGQKQVKRAWIADEAVLNKVSAWAFGHAPSRCSMCSSLKHNAWVCLTRVI